MSRLGLNAAVGAALLPLVFGLPAGAQRIGEDLAAVLEELGCEASETLIAERFRARGFEVGDYQAQASALMRGGHLVAGEAQGALRLVNWGSCP